MPRGGALAGFSNKGPWALPFALCTGCGLGVTDEAREELSQSFGNGCRKLEKASPTPGADARPVPSMMNSFQTTLTSNPEQLYEDSYVTKQY